VIAQVYPVIRMPQSRAGSGGGVFDYAIPEDLAREPGDVIRVPFRGRTVMGVVKSLQPTSTFGTIKPIDGSTPLFRLSSQEIAYFEQIAQELGISVPTVLYNAFPQAGARGPRPVSESAVQKLSIPTTDVERLSSDVRSVLRASRAFVWCEDIRYAAALIAGVQKTHTGPTLILCPNVRDVRLMSAYLSSHAPTVVTGDETEPRRFANWMQWRNAGGIFIGTRIAALMPHPSLSAIYIIRSGHDNHREPKRVPPFDARIGAERLAELVGAKLIACDAAPTSTQLLPDRTIIGRAPDTDTLVVSQSKERPHAEHVFVSPSASAAIAEALAHGQRVLAVLNRKDATSKIGLGISEAARGLRAAFPTATVAILEKAAASVPRSDILVTTRFYIENVFNPAHPEGFGLVADLDPDALLYSSLAGAIEETMRTCFEWRAVAHANRCPFIVQTTRPELFERMFSDPIGLLKQEADAAGAYRNLVDNVPKT